MAARTLRIALLSIIIVLLFLVVDMFALLFPKMDSPAVVCGSAYIGGDGGILYRSPIIRYINRSAFPMYIEEPEFFIGMPSHAAARRLLIPRVLSNSGNTFLKDYRKVVGLEPALKISELLRNSGLKVALYVRISRVRPVRKGGRVKFEVEQFTAMVGDKLQSGCATAGTSDTLVVDSPLTFCGCPSGSVRWLSGEEVEKILNDGNAQASVIRWFISGDSLRKVQDVLADTGVLIVTPSFYSSFTVYLAIVSVLGMILTVVVWLIYLAVSELLGSAEIVSYTRRFFVLYTLGRPIRWISLRLVIERLWDLVLALLIAISFLWMTGVVLQRVYMPPSMVTVFYYGNLQNAAGVSAVLQVPPAWHWRCVAWFLLVMLVLGIEYIFSFAGISRSFFARGSRVIPMRKMVVSVAVLTVIVSICITWTLWAGIRLYHAYRLYRVDGFSVADTDFGFLHLRMNLAKEAMEENGIDGLLIAYSPESSLIRYCPIGVSGGNLWGQISSHVMFLWGAKSAEVDCSFTNSQNRFGVYLLYVDSQKLKQFAQAYYRLWIEELAKAGADLGKGFEIDKQVSYMIRSFTSMADLISFSLWRAILLAWVFAVFAALSAFGLGYALSELVVVLLPYRVAVFMALGETVTGALRKVVRMVVFPVLIGAVVATGLTVILLVSVWRAMYVRPVFVINLTPLGVVFLILIFVYVGIVLTSAGIRREGVISIMKRDL